MNADREKLLAALAELDFRAHKAEREIMDADQWCPDCSACVYGPDERAARWLRGAVEDVLKIARGGESVG